MNRTTQIFAIAVILLLIPACASVPRQSNPSQNNDTIPMPTETEVSCILAKAWENLSHEDFSGALKAVASLTVENRMAPTPTLQAAQAEAWRLKAWIHHVRGELLLEANAWEQSIISYTQSDRVAASWLRYVNILSHYGEWGAIRDSGIALLQADNLEARAHSEITFATARAFANLGDYPEAENLFQSLGFADAWSVIGPFNGVAGSGFGRTFGPELNSNPGLVHKDDWDIGHQWRPIENLKMAWVDLGAQYGETHDMVFYGMTFATVAGETPAVIKLGLSGGTQVWLNGQLVLASETPRFLHHDLYEVDVVLQPGENSILVKVCGSGGYPAGLSLRLTDRQDNPLSKVRWAVNSSRGNDNVAAEELSLSSGNEVDSPVWPTFAHARTRYLETGDLDSALTLADMADYGDFEAELLREFPALSSEFEQATPLLGLLADCYFLTGRMDLVKATHSLMESLNPEAAIGFVSRSAQMMAEGQGDEVFNEALKRWKRNPETIEFLKLAALAAQNLEKRYELDKLIREWESILPNDPQLILTRGGETGLIIDPQQKVAYLREKWENQRENEEIFLALTSAYVEAFDLEGAIKLLEERRKSLPYSPFIPFTQAVFAGMKGNLPAATHWAREAVELAPDSPDFKQLLGDILNNRGDYAAAQDLFKDALLAQPDNWELRQMVWAMSSDQEEPEGFLTETTDDLIASDRNQPAYPDAPNYLLLDDVHRTVLADYASKVTYRVVGRVNDDRGVQEMTQQVLSLPNQCFDFYVEKLVTIKPDNRQVQGEVSQDGISFTNLERGDYFELVYTCYISSATFMGREIWQAHLLVGNCPRKLSRFQLLHPEGMEIQVARPTAALVQKITLGNEMSLTSWYVEDAPALDFEAGLTTAALSPFILDFSSVGSWAEVGDWYERQTHRQCKPNDRITVFAQELVAGATSDREKALAIARFVTSRIAYSEPQFQLAMVTPGAAENTLDRGIGDCKDQCALILALARAVGIDGSLALMHTELGRDYPFLPSIRFNHVIAGLKLGEETMWVDPTTGFGDPTVLPTHLQGAEVLLLAGNSSQLLRLPVESPQNSRVDIHTDLAVDADGLGTQSTRVAGKGTGAMAILAISASLSGKEYHQFVEASYSKGTGDVEVHKVEMPDTDTLRPEAEFSFEAVRRLHFVSLGEEIGVQAPFQTSIQDLQMPSLRGRGSELDVIPARGIYSEQVVVQLPASIVASSLPDEVILDIPEASFRFAVRAEGTTLVFERELIIKALVITADRCDAFADFLNKASKAERSMVVLNVQKGPANKDKVIAAK